MPMTSNLVSATGTVRGSRVKIGAIYGNCTTAGVLQLRDGGASGTLIVSIPMAVGNIAIEPCDHWHFNTDCHATLASSLAGSFSFQAI